MAQSFSSLFPLLMRWLEAHVLVRARTFLPRGSAALSAWLSPSQNPFLQKALRVEERKHKPLFSIAIVAVLSTLACCFVWRLWLYLQFQIEGNALHTSGWRGLVTAQDLLLGIFGKHPLGWFALLTALISACGVLWSSRARGAYLLRQELLKNTLVQLQELPIAEERWVWLMAAHPALIGVLIGLCGLPVYLLAVFTGLWNASDIFGLGILFFLLGHAAPSWMPAAWQQQNAASKPVKMTWQQWREWTKQTHIAARSGDMGSVLENQRKMQRAASGLSEEYSALDNDANDTKEKSRFALFRANTNVNANARGGISRWWSVIAVNFLFQAAKGVGVAPLHTLTASWPREALALLPAFPLTWPLLFAKVALAPLPFFAFLWPPIFLILPLWIAASHQKFVTLAGNVSAAETFWTAARLRRRENIQWLLAAGVLLFGFGYLWQILIEGGQLARLLNGATTTPRWALAALWTLALAASTIAAGLQMETPFKRALANAADSPTDLRPSWRESTRRIARALFFGIGAYFLACVLSARLNINSIWLSRLPITIATCAAFLLADFGSGAWHATLPPSLRRLWSVARMAWFHGLGIVALVLIARAALQGKTFSFDSAPFVLFSPFVTLSALFRSNAPQQFSVQPIVWITITLQAAAGVFLLLLARRAIFSEASVARDEVETSSDAPLPLRQRKWLRPLFIIEAIVLWPLQFPIRWLESFGEAVNSWNAAIVRWGEKFDNPVFTYELRRRLRKENWAWQWLGIFAGEAVLFLTFAQPWQLLFSGAQMPVFVRAVAYNNFAVWGGIVTNMVLVLLAALGVLACLGIGRAFDADRANGTLVFLFLTPQADREILIGKWAGGVLHICGLLSTGLVWLATGVFVASVPGLSPLTFLLALCGLIAIVATVLLASTINLFFAVRAKKPTDAQSRALLSYLVVAAVLTFFFACVMGMLERMNVVASDEIIAIFLLLLSALIEGLLAALAWRLALREFAKRRYGDLEASGKGAS